MKLALLELVDERVRKIEVRREDFLELQAVVRELAEAQVGTERRLSQLTERVDALTGRVDALAAQMETLTRRVDALAGGIEALAQAQARTEAAVQQLAQQVGRLSDHVGFGLEDIAHFVPPSLPQGSAGTRAASIDSSSRRSSTADNLIFHRRAALDALGERLLDANRTIGQPKKITVIFGRKVTRQHRGKLQTEIEDLSDDHDFDVVQ